MRYKDQPYDLYQISSILVMFRAYRELAIGWARHLAMGLVLGTITLISACSATVEQYYDLEAFASVPKIDAHVHINTGQTEILQQAEKDNFYLFSINVDYPEFPSVHEQLAVSLQLQEQSERFEFAGTFLMGDWQDPLWQAQSWQFQAISQIDDAVRRGAKAIKVWKNVGMSLKNANEQLVMVNDPALSPIFEYLAARNIVLIGHQGEPKNCWLALEHMTVNNDREYFSRHPEYHMYLHPELPSYEDQMSARNAVLEAHPSLHFVGAHMASLEWSVDELAAFLDAFPNAVVDIAARSGQIQYQSQQNREKVRAFFIRYQDRILYATDLTHIPGIAPEKFSQMAHAKWIEDWKYFATNISIQVPEVNGDIKGLQLPKSVIDKLYFTNAQRALRIHQKGG